MTGVAARVRLLAGQAFALGALLAWTTIPANTIFLDTFGPGLLPVTYIVAAVAGAASSVVLGRALERRPITSVLGRLLLAVVVVLAVVWVALVAAGVDGLSFLVVSLLPVALPVGFMFVVGEAGLLLDVRTLKVAYPRVVAGFALGFTVGGLLGGPLLQLLGGTEQLFAVAALAAVALLGLVRATVRRFPAELAATEEAQERVPARALLSNRLVALIVAAQALSAIESQWLDFLVYDRASQRYPQEADLAVFVGRFTAVAYGLDIVFLLLIAGALLRRHGLRLGLAANPAAVLAMVVALGAASASVGGGATVVFLLVVASRVVDLVLSDGTTRTSISAAYQALAGRERLGAQALAESLAVPVAIGLAGAVLLALRSTVGTDGPALLVLLVLVLGAWVVCAAVAFQQYRRSLLTNLRHRVLQPSELGIEGPATARTIARLLASDDPATVRLGAEALVAAEPEEAAELLAEATVEGAALAHPDPEVRAAVAAVLAESELEPALVAVAARYGDDDRRVELAAARATARLGAPVPEGLRHQVEELAAADDPADRRHAGELLACLRGAGGLDAAVLDRLLVDPDPVVEAAALGALDLRSRPERLGRAMELLGDRHLMLVAVEVIGRAGDLAVPALGDRLVDPSTSVGDAAGCARALRSIGTDAAVAALRAGASAGDRDVGRLALEALADLAPEEPATEALPVDPWHLELLGVEVEHAARIVAAALALRDAELPGDGPLLDALADEVALVRARVLALLSPRLGRTSVDRARGRLASPDLRVRSAAMEWFEVSLAPDDRAALVLVDPDLGDEQRRRKLERLAPTPVPTRDEAVADLLLDPQGTWRRSWLRACAALAAHRSPEGSIAAALLVPANRPRGGPAAAPGEGVLDEALRQLDVALAGPS